MDASLRFYRDRLGFVVVAQGRIGEDVKSLWGIQPGCGASCALLEASASRIGRILLAEFSGGGRERVRQPGDRMTFGF